MFETKKGIIGLLHISIILSLIFAFPLINELKKNSLIQNELIEKEIQRKVVLRYITNPAHAESFISICDRFRFDWILAIAISKVESQHYQYACSSFPARGYFQVTDDTFKYIGEEFKGLTFINKWSVYDGANNIFAGVCHINRMINKYGRDLGLQLYNVGEGNYFFRGWRNPKYVNDVLNSYQSILSNKIALEELLL